MAVNVFDPAATPLTPGINLIEASAGTGKTYTVAMLVVRFVVEQAIPIQQLLTVTFAKAATEELKERVRLRLTDVSRVLKNPASRTDPTILSWLEGLKNRLETAQIRHRVEMALIDIDQAGIFTIHGFCQRVLKDHALAGGQLFDAGLADDVHTLKQACADDYWRRQLYPRSPWDVAALTAIYKTPEALLTSIDGIPATAVIEPEPEDLDNLLLELKDAAKKIASVPNLHEALETACTANKFKTEYRKLFESELSNLRAWAAGATPLLPPLEVFSALTPQGLLDGLNGTQFRAAQGQSADQRKADFLKQLAVDLTPFEQANDLLKRIQLSLRQALLTVLHDQLELKLQEINKFTYDNLITRLAERLRSEHGASLRLEIGSRFQVALIDEFQDTDADQWLIFSKLFNADAHYLYLIGDPKQAIYRFRGADIHTYLGAQEQAQYRFTLDKNRRSGPWLIKAVNTLFKREAVFKLAGLNFYPAGAALTEDEGALTLNNKAVPPLVFWQMPPSEQKNTYWPPGDKAVEILLGRTVAGEILKLLTEAYRLPGGEPVQPKDIAVLVRSNRQASDFQALLRQASLPAVINSLSSVFGTPEADALYCLLSALAYPSDIRLLKQALSLDWFGLSGPELYALTQNEAAFNQWSRRFADYHQHWQERGLLAMMQTLLHHERIALALAASECAERALTNIHHLLELLQQAATEERLSIGKTPAWLGLAIAESKQKRNAAENQQMRLESDESAIQIITMHRAKGLEYGIVFCPFLWQTPSERKSYYVKCRDRDGDIFDLGSTYFDKRKEKADEEQLAEELRLAYVALTRAKYRCYVAWVNARTKDKENNSALAWLLNFKGTDFAAQQEYLKQFAQDQAVFDHHLLALDFSARSGYLRRVANPLKSPRKLNRSLYSSWQMSSYTALSALSIQDAPELPPTKNDERPASDASTTDVLPGGAVTGTIIHALLETLSFNGLARGSDLSDERDIICRRYGYLPEQPSLIDNLLYTIVTTPLAADDSDFCLKNIDDAHCLKEMPFYLALEPLQVHHINTILHASPVFQPLTGKILSGYLTGFIDLVCVHRGRYYVIDYKTNLLNDYDQPALVAAMREHNYGLQYWLYSLVLHCYLRQRLPDYSYDNHFGGVRYLFVRGMDPKQTLRGIYQDRPDLATLNALAALFGIPL